MPALRLMASALHCPFFKHPLPHQSECGLAQLFKDLSTPLGTRFGGNCGSGTIQLGLFLQNLPVKQTQWTQNLSPHKKTRTPMKPLHSLVTALLFTQLMAPAFAQRMYDSSGRQIGRVDAERFYNASGQQIGRADGLRRMQMVVFFYFFM